MANAGDIITDAMQSLGVLGAGKTPGTADLSDNLRKLNAMLERWSLSTLMVPYSTQISHTLDGSLSYTVGTGGDINTDRPTRVNHAYSTRNTTDYPVYVAHDRNEYDRIVKKDVEGIPRMIYYEPTMPLGTLYVYYAGNASDTLTMDVQAQLTQFADTTTDYTLPPGYYELFYSNLAMIIAPAYEVTVSMELAKLAKESLSEIKRANRRLPVMRYDDAIPRGRHYYNIESDS